MDKYQNIKAFVSAVSEYVTNQTSESAVSILERNLMAISTSTDLSIFDPGSDISSVFYVHLHELMSNLGCRSNLIWIAVDVLQTACKNNSARNAFIHTYKFTPILTKLLESNLISEKRIKVLKLLQELTYGITISWQEAHLPYLIITLSQWSSQSNEEEVISLSLGVLVNLCYKNRPAVFALMRCVNVKAFLTGIIKARWQNVNIRVQCCKLLIIFENTNSDILDTHILDVASITFKSIIKTLKDNDILLLRHIVDFFEDIRQNERFRNILLTYPSYTKDVENILKTLNDVSNQECASYIMEFLLSLVKLKVAELVKLYPLIVKVILTWISKGNVGSKALALIRMIVVESRRTKNINTKVLEEVDLLALVLLIKEEDMDDSCNKSNVEIETNLIECMRLLQELVKTPAIRVKVLEILSLSKMHGLMKSILESHNDSIIPENSRNIFNDSSTQFYIHALALTADLATNNTDWLTLYTELLQRKHLQKIMAIALFTGDTDVKQKVLQLTSTVGFPNECIVAVSNFMSNLGPLLLVQDKVNINNVSESFAYSNTYDTLPFTITQEERLDEFISELEKILKENSFSSVPTSAIMQLYEYKMESMRHSERAMQVSLESASNHATNLQHRVAQLNAQLNQLYQVLFTTQQCLECSQKEKIAFMTKLQETEERTNKQHTTQVQEISGLKRIVLDKDNQISQYISQIKQLETHNKEIPILTNKLKDMTDKNLELNKTIQKLQESINKREQTIEEQSREISSNQSDITALNQELEQQRKQCQKYQVIISEKDGTVQKLTSELNNLSRMRDMIFELTAKKKDDLQISK